MSSAWLRDAVVIRIGSGCFAIPARYPRGLRSTRLNRDHPYDQGRRRPTRARSVMSNRISRVTEVIGTSPDGIDQAIRNGIERASRTLRHLDWFEVTQVRGQVRDDQVEHFQVGLKLGFRLEDD